MSLANATESEGQAGTLRYKSARGRLVLGVTVAGSAMAMIDGTVVGIALPFIGRDFHASVAGLQWVATAYLLTLSGLLLLGGSLADRFGRRRIFMFGVAWFAVSSLICGLAPNGPFLIAARALQGIGSAMLTPGSLAILQAGFVPEDRSRAIGAWSGLGGIAAAAGPLLGGYLISVASWRFVFFINLPIAFSILLIAARHVPETRDPGASSHLDIFGSLLIVGGLIGLTYAIVEAPATSWSSLTTILSLSLGAAGLIGFVLVERHGRAPLVPISIFASRQFSGANLVTFVVYGALGGALFLLPIDLEQVAHYSPIKAGVSLVPVTLLMLAFSARSGALAAKIGPRLQMSLGPIVVGAGFALFARINASGNYLSEVLPAAVVLGVGLVITVAPLTSTVLAAAPFEHAGVASAINNDVARVAALVAVAALPPLVGLGGSAYLHPMALSRGFHDAAWICALLCVAGGLLALALISNAELKKTNVASIGRWHRRGRANLTALGRVDR